MGWKLIRWEAIREEMQVEMESERTEYLAEVELPVNAEVPVFVLSFLVHTE